MLNVARGVALWLVVAVVGVGCGGGDDAGSPGGGGSAGSSGASGSGGANTGGSGGANTGGTGNTGAGKVLVLSELKAFATAQGHGRHTSGGRGGSVYEVTTLANSGAGSFRDAVSSGNRTVVFRVGGTITLNKNQPVYFGGDNITLAGQTAPGDGVAIYGEMVDTNGHENIIVRHLRFRSGDPQDGTDRDAFRIINLVSGKTAQNFILDHCSFSWGDDEVLSFEARSDEKSTIKNATVQRSIVSEGFDNKGVILWKANQNISFIGNLLANNHERNIRASTRISSFEMVNNVIYGYAYGTQPTYENSFDVIGNAYLVRPGLPQALETVRLEACSSTNCPGGASIGATQAHIADNTLGGGAISVSSNLTPYLFNTPRVSSGYAALPSGQVESDVLGDVGCNFNGNDSLDKSQINDVLNGSGAIVTSEAGTAGLPTLMGGTPEVDANSDGIPDTFASTHGISSATDVIPNWKFASYQVSNVAGYTALEMYLMWAAGDFDTLVAKLP